MLFIGDGIEMTLNKYRNTNKKLKAIKDRLMGANINLKEMSDQVKVIKKQ